MKSLFIVTSAVESRFGIYTADQRLSMTLDTIKCLRQRVPGCKIVMNEVSGNGLDASRETALMDAVDLYLDFTTNSEVRWIYNNPAWYQNWDIVKNLTELTTFPQSLKILQDSGEVDGINRVFKMSGRYLLNDKFDIDFYQRPEVATQVVIGKSVPSQFPYEVTGLRTQYMCRLLSWPVQLHSDMITWYQNGRDYMKQRMSMGGYADIEHCLYFAIPKERVYEVDEVGVYGNIAPNGIPIVN